jgi:C4-dicarboxylate transporter DctM subunit
MPRGHHAVYAASVALAASVDPVWFGIFIIIMCELGMITPPVGMNLFVVQWI